MSSLCFFGLFVRSLCAWATRSVRVCFPEGRGDEGGLVRRRASGCRLGCVDCGGSEFVRRNLSFLATKPRSGTNRAVLSHCRNSRPGLLLRARCFASWKRRNSVPERGFVAKIGSFCCRSRPRRVGDSQKVPVRTRPAAIACRGFPLPFANVLPSDMRARVAPALRSSKHLRASVTRRRSPGLLPESLARGVARCPSPAALAPSFSLY